MADQMGFPKTIQEFIEGYSFKDSDEVYTNGAELIPVFRVEQALEHYLTEVRAKAIDEFAKKLIELVYEFPLVENEDGEKRPMTIEEMCNQVAEQLKGV